MAGLAEADLNGDVVADFRIIFDNGALPLADDFVLQRQGTSPR